jgi:predicted TPR repeat methyltransferase
MLDRARDRGLYDALVCEELTAFLARSPGAFDLIVATDVLIYFGDLAPLFEATAAALRPGGWLAVSFEDADADAGVPGVASRGQPGLGYSFRPSGRFAHALSYVLGVAEPRLARVASRATTLRREGRQRVAGQLLVLRRPVAP